MLCSVYGICKVMEREIKFKDIIRTYSELPQASPNVSTSKRASCNADKKQVIWNRHVHLHRSTVLSL